MLTPSLVPYIAFKESYSTKFLKFFGVGTPGVKNNFKVSKRLNQRL